MYIDLNQQVESKDAFIENVTTEYQQELKRHETGCGMDQRAPPTSSYQQGLFAEKLGDFDPIPFRVTNLICF